MDKKQVLEKIKKLMSLANSSNENEAKVATDKANELLVRYNLSMQDITEDRKYSSTTIESGARRKYHQELIYSILMEFFFIEVVQSRLPGIKYVQKGHLKAIFIGEEHNVQIAKYVFDFLNKAFESGWKDFYKKYSDLGFEGLKTHKKSYHTGFYAGVRENLLKVRTRVEQETGLVVIKDPQIKDFIDEMFGSTKTGKHLSVDNRGGIAMDEGYQQGKDTHIAMGLSGSGEKEYIDQPKLQIAGVK